MTAIESTPLLRDEYICLRPLKPTDAEDIHACVHDPEIQRFTDVPAAEQYPISAAEEFITETLVGVTRWVVCQIDDPKWKLLGAIELRPGPDNYMEIGYYTAPWARRRGFMARALTVVTQYALSRGIGRVMLRVDQANLAGRDLAEKCGFIPIDDEANAPRITYYLDAV